MAGCVFVYWRWSGRLPIRYGLDGYTINLIHPSLLSDGDLRSPSLRARLRAQRGFGLTAALPILVDDAYYLGTFGYTTACCCDRILVCVQGR